MSNLIQIKNILEKYNKTPEKSLGQNFLIDPEIPKKTAALCLGADPGAGALEIGPGPGILTRELCKLSPKVAAVEIDRSFEPVFLEFLSGLDNFKIIFGDILETDLKDLISKEFAGIKNICVCANLPYYITTPIILKLIKGGVKFKNITLMVQKEAADKLCAKAGDANYNATSVITSYYGDAKKIFNVPRSCFYPQPKILSTVVKITPRAEIAAAPKCENLMFDIINAAFGQRRKTLANALASGLGLNGLDGLDRLDKKIIIDIIKKAAGSENIRGEELDFKTFADISDMIFDFLPEHK